MGGFMWRLARCCCCSTSESSGCLESAFEYPKRARLGCLWLEIHSKLHENLIADLFLSFFFLTMYVWLVLEPGSFGCPQVINWRHGQIRFTDIGLSCVLLYLRKIAGVLSFVVYIPCLIICLYSIRRLDAVDQIVEDIVKLQELKNEVETFGLRIRTDRERERLLEALRCRVMGRIDIVNAFTTYSTQFSIANDPQALLRGTEFLVCSLKNSRRRLGHPMDWLAMTDEQRSSEARWMEREARKFTVNSSYFAFDVAEPTYNMQEGQETLGMTSRPDAGS